MTPGQSARCSSLRAAIDRGTSRRSPPDIPMVVPPAARLRRALRRRGLVDRGEVLRDLVGRHRPAAVRTAHRISVARRSAGPLRSVARLKSVFQARCHFDRQTERDGGGKPSPPRRDLRARWSGIITWRGNSVIWARSQARESPHQPIRHDPNIGGPRIDRAISPRSPDHPEIRTKSTPARTISPVGVQSTGHGARPDAQTRGPSGFTSLVFAKARARPDDRIRARSRTRSQARSRIREDAISQPSYTDQAWFSVAVLGDSLEFYRRCRSGSATSRSAVASRERASHHQAADTTGTVMRRRSVTCHPP